jgi:hypothetical protein
MHNASRHPTAVFATILLSLCALPLAAQSSQPEALQAVNAAVAAEMQADHTDHSIWTYHDHDQTPELDATYLTIETHHGMLRRMIASDGHTLSPSDAQAETARIDSYAHDPAAQARTRRNGAHDDAQATELLKMLPTAFTWTIASQTPDLITLHFVPNSSFDPPDMQAHVMGTMEGEMVIARDGNRIRTLRGRLSHSVLVGFGILARLYAGGTFDVERRLVGEGHWQITETHVHIGGHALFFKSIGTQEDEVKTDWQPSNDDTLEEAAHTLDTER